LLSDKWWFLIDEGHQITASFEGSDIGNSGLKLHLQRYLLPLAVVLVSEYVAVRSGGLSEQNQVNTLQARSPLSPA